MHDFKKNKTLHILRAALFGLLVVVGFYPTSAFADATTYFSERKAELAKTYDLSPEMPVITRSLTEDTTAPVNQKIFFGPVTKLGNAAPYPKAMALGTGTTPNKTNLFVNVRDEFTSGNYSMSTNNANDLNLESGLSIYRPSVGPTKTEALYLDPKNTEYYYQNNSNGDEIIKVLSVTRPSYNNNKETERYVLEYTITASKDSNDIDVVAEVTNGTGSDIDLAVMYTTVLNTTGRIAGTTATTTGSIRSLGDNRGVSIQQEGRDMKYDVENTVLFPDEAEDGPKNWIIGSSGLINSFNGFIVSPGVSGVTGTGFEKGYTAEEATKEGNPYLVGKPYRPGYKFNNEAYSDRKSLRMKTAVKNTKPDESVKLHWKVRFGEMKLKKIDNSIYRDMDQQTGEELEDFDLLGKSVPIEVNVDRVQNETQVRNFMIFGGQDRFKDTLESITSGKNNDKSKINTDYRRKQVGILHPRVVTYNKNYMNKAVTSYSYPYQEPYENADGPNYGGSGFGIATFQNNLVENNIPKDIIASSEIEEFYISKDGRVAKVYGMYKFGTGLSIPIKMTIESANDKGKGRMTIEYMNTLDHTTNFNSYYSVHMDINHKHEDSQMKTLGGREGVYFQEDNLSALAGAKYYVAFYTRNSNNGVAVDNLNAYNLDLTNRTNPRGWDVVGASEKAHLPKFVETQKKGEVLCDRDTTNNGAILTNPPKHPGWFFTYASQELKPNEIGRADLELKVTDLEDIIYPAVKIYPEKNKVANSLTDFVYQPIIEQDMRAIMKTEGHKADNVEITTEYNPYVETKKEDISVYADDQLLSDSLYTLTIDSNKNEMTVLFKDPVPWNLKNKTIEIKQKSNITTNETTNGIMTYYDKPSQSFLFDITSHNSWDIHDDSTELREVQDPKTKEVQAIKYVPIIEAKAKEGMTVASGSLAGDATDYIKDVNQPDFLFDKFEAKFKGTPPVFTGTGDKTFVVIVESKEFGNFIEVPVTVKVREEVNMTVKRFVETPDGATEQLVDLKTSNLDTIKDVTTKVKGTADFAKIIADYEKEEITGYDHVNTIVKVGNTVVTDYSKVPNTDFVIELYYKGKVMLDYPETFDFGSHQLSVLGKDEVRPKISKDGNTDDGEMKMQVINTQGNGGVWKLSAKQSKELINGGEAFKGKIYYISDPKSSPVEIDDAYKKIELDAKNEKIISKVPLLPENLNTKTGLYIDIYPGNKLGNYTGGEITWNLEDTI